MRAWKSRATAGEAARVLWLGKSRTRPLRLLCPHRFRTQPILFAPFPVCLRGDFAGLDLAAAAPEDVGVAHRDADGTEMFVDGLLVGEDALLFHSVGDAH